MNPAPRKAPRLSMLVPVLLAGWTASGCVGGTAYYQHTFRLESPQIDPVHGFSSAPELPSMTQEQVLAALGKPERIDRLSADEERWIYKGGEFHWSGLALALVVVPVPLLVPTGHDHLVISWKGERALAVEWRHHVDSTALFGFVQQMCGISAGLTTDHSDSTHGDRTIPLPWWLAERCKAGTGS